MTTRERLNRLRRCASLIAFPGFVLFGLGMALSEGKWPYAAVGVCGFIVFGTGILVMVLAGRCLHCRRRLGQMFSHNGLPWQISSDLRFCPFCGRSLDEDSGGRPGYY